MFVEPKEIESSYNINNIGKDLYDMVIKYKPTKVVEFGLLYGYSTVSIAQGLRDNNIENSKLLSFDLFDDYEYKHSVRSVVEHNLERYNLSDLVQLNKTNFYEWMETNEDFFDMIHLDISNNGHIINDVYNYTNKLSILHNKEIITIFEGGTVERDNVEWMNKYSKPKINPLKNIINYNIIRDEYPGLSYFTTKK
jgi:predicted O-methyltransferase YrrM